MLVTTLTRRATRHDYRVLYVRAPQLHGFTQPDSTVQSCLSTAQHGCPISSHIPILAQHIPSPALLSAARPTPRSPAWPASQAGLVLLIPVVCLIMQVLGLNDDKHDGFANGGGGGAIYDQEEMKLLKRHRRRGGKPSTSERGRHGKSLYGRPVREIEII